MYNIYKIMKKFPSNHSKTEWKLLCHVKLVAKHSQALNSLAFNLGKMYCNRSNHKEACNEKGWCLHGCAGQTWNMCSMLITILACNIFKVGISSAKLGVHLINKNSHDDVHLYLTNMCLSSAQQYQPYYPKTLQCWRCDCFIRVYKHFLTAILE